VVDGETDSGFLVVLVIQFDGIEFAQEPVSRWPVLHPVVFKWLKAVAGWSVLGSGISAADQGTRSPVVKFMSNRSAESGHAGGDWHEPHTATAEDRLQRIAKASAKHIAFNERVAVKSNAHSTAVCLYPRKRFKKLVQGSTVATVIFDAGKARPAGF